MRKLVYAYEELTTGNGFISPGLWEGCPIWSDQSNRNAPYGTHVVDSNRQIDGFTWGTGTVTVFSIFFLLAIYMESFCKSNIPKHGYQSIFLFFFTYNIYGVSFFSQRYYQSTDTKTYPSNSYFLNRIQNYPSSCTYLYYIF